MKNKVLKIAIIGAGSRGIDCFAKALCKRDDCRITALCDPNHVRMEKMLTKLPYQDINMYCSQEEMIAAEKLDACIISSPDYCHADNAVFAIQNGLDVLIDKPLATTVSDCKKILKAAEKFNKVVMIGFNLRHHPVLKHAKEMIDAGTIGKVFLIENREFYANGRSYMSRWNRHYEQSGGLWIHKGSHDFDVFNWMLDFPKPKKVASVAGVSIFKPECLPFATDDNVAVGPTCSDCAYKKKCPDVKSHEDNPEWGEEARKVDGYAKDVCMYISEKSVHDNGFAIIEYDGGIRACHMECFVTGISDRRYTIVGDKGQLEISTSDKTIIFRPRWQGETTIYTQPEVEGGHGGADPKLVEAFITAIKTGNEINSTIQHGMLATALGQAAELAARENRTVMLDELL